MKYKCVEFIPMRQDANLLTQTRAPLSLFSTATFTATQKPLTKSKPSASSFCYDLSSTLIYGVSLSGFLQRFSQVDLGFGKITRGTAVTGSTAYYLVCESPRSSMRAIGATAAFRQSTSTSSSENLFESQARLMFMPKYSTGLRRSDVPDILMNL